MFILLMKNNKGNKKYLCSNDYIKLINYINYNYYNVRQINEFNLVGKFDDEEIFFNIKLGECLDESVE